MNSAANQNRPADHEVRVQALDPAQSCIVQAPAGSGKTELLTRRYLRLLACVQAPEDILAITFTRKAAAEMRHRVLSALALAELDEPPEATHRRDTWELARAARETDLRHGWRLASHPSRLRIQTIDSFNQQLARRLPILSGAGAPLGIAEDADALYAEAVQRLVERLGGHSEEARAIERLVRHLDNNVDLFESLLKSLLARRDHWLDLGLLRVDRTHLRARLEEAVELAVIDRLGRVRDALPAHMHHELTELASFAARNLLASGRAGALTACTDMKAFPGTKSDSLPLWRGMAALLLTSEGGFRKPKGINVTLGFDPAAKMQKQALGALLEQLAHDDEFAVLLHETRSLPGATYEAGQWEVLDALLDVLRIAVGELELVFRERGEADYVSAALAARRALGSTDEPTDLALRLDYRLRHILVDEFQDTSRGQVELLRLLTAGWSEGDGRSLFCVGDPMQSIYRFRQADVGLFLSLREAGLNDITLQALNLTVNFRSTQPIVAWVNDTFSRVLPAHDDPVRGAVSYTASQPRPGALAEGGIRVHPLVGAREDARAGEACTVADIAQAALSRDEATRVAILVTSRSHLPRIVAELTTRGLPYQAVDIDPLVDRPVVQDLLALTRALLHLADRTAWLSVLRAPWCGLTLADLHALAADAPQSAVWSLMADPACLARLSPDGSERLVRVARVLARALQQRGRHPLRDWVERCWHELNGPATLSMPESLQDAAAYFERLSALERSGDHEDVTRLEQQLGELFAVPGTGGARIEVMTIHRAKGLEFDVVILPALERAPRSDDPPLLRWSELSRADTAPSLLLAPMAPRGEEPDALHAWLGNLEKERAGFERGRLLYVAATRAIRELHLIGHAQVEAGEDAGRDSGAASGVKTPPRGSFLELLWPMVEGDFHSAAARHVGAPQESAQATARPLRRLPLAWQAPAPEPAYRSTVLEAVSDDALQPVFDWAGEASRHVGTLVHREIDRFVRQVSPGLDASSLAARQPHYEQELAELGVPQELRATSALRVIDALGRMLGDARGRWILGLDQPQQDAVSELELTGVIRDEIVRGVIDRCFRDADGIRWIVDFKTSVHEGGGREEFLASEELRYRPQLLRYAALMRAYRPGERIRAALYFPLMGEWREIDVS